MDTKLQSPVREMNLEKINQQSTHSISPDPLRKVRLQSEYAEDV